MATWHTLPTTYPIDGEEVWIRLNLWWSVPFLAVFDKTAGTFYYSTLDWTFPWYTAIKWRSQ